MNKGKVYLVGAGCGDYDLITLRGQNCLKKAEVVVYDSLTDKLLLEYADSSAEKICVGKRAGRHSEKQENINEILIAKAKEGKTVVRLKGGDPFVFGRGGEEVQALQNAGIQYEVVPGISSAIAVPELAGIPVTHRNLSRSVHIITGHTAQDTLPENIREYAKLDGTLVFLMGLRKLPEIVSGLVTNGKNESTPVAIVSNGAYAKDSTVRGTLKNICQLAEQSKAEPPAIIIVGEVAGFDFSATIEKPLKNINVAVTGTHKLSSKLGRELMALGARINCIDYLSVKEYQQNTQLDNALQNIDNYNYIVLTSMNGAEIFIKRLRALKLDVRKLCNVKFAVIGSGTAGVLEKYGIFADIIPKVYTSVDLGNLLADTVKADERVLIMRAENGSRELTQILSDSNVSYDDVKTYDILSEKNSEASTITADYITFASSSGVNAFFESGYTISDNTKIVCIGEITAKALSSHNISDYKIARTKDVVGIINTIISDVKKRVV
ncbi:uroporphyrinogen-III C-methyltransferase [Ruminococcus sp.]|uniref:uroporphyrinogen-III C-methyltransferase n=1 Tax=Ruminococcus sp. TaxID=41978 RepID=UPI00386A4F81